MRMRDVDAGCGGGSSRRRKVDGEQDDSGRGMQE